MARFDLYSTVHKGLRRALFDATSEAGRCDPWEAAEAARLADAALRLVDFLEEHAALEDTVLMPELAALSPELHAALREEHARGDGLQREVRAMADRLRAAAVGRTPADLAARPALARRLGDGLARLTALHLVHMAREELEANRVLQAHHDDGQLRALHARILAAVTPARTADWLALFLPALSASEQVGVLAGLRGTPAELRWPLAAAARSALGEPAFTRAAAAAGLEP